jgi:hypothetical protein
MSDAGPAVTVVTITRRRPALLRRCAASVRAQVLPRPPLHLILADACEASLAALAPDARTRLVKVERSAGEKSGPSRLAGLRNLAATLVQTPWLAFLDDDCEYVPDHLSTLLQQAEQSGADAVHSHRLLLRSDGAPFLELRWPWCRDHEEGRKKYDQLRELGVVEPGSCVIKDRIDGSRDLWLVDTNEWLISSAWLRSHPMSETFSEHDWIANLAEDDKLLDAMREAGTRIACTFRPTVRYYLGGYSNDFQGLNQQTERWAWEPPAQELGGHGG